MLRGFQPDKDGNLFWTLKYGKVENVYKYKHVN